MVGTHTHTPSADHRILAGGTGFITDVGMTGDYDSVIGMEKDEPLRRFTLRIPSGRFEPALGPGDAVRRCRGNRPRRPDQSHRAGPDRRSAQPRRTRFLELMPCTVPTIVYDLDGTLADTAEDLVATLNWLLAREGLAPLPVESAGSLVGAGARALIKRGFAASGRSLDPQTIEVLFVDYLSYYSDHIAIAPGFIRASTRRSRASHARAGGRRSAPTRSRAWPSCW